MYHISVYFDEKTNSRLEQVIRAVAGKSGNTFMTENNVPPHITVSAVEFSTSELNRVMEFMDENVVRIGRGEVFFATVGQFMPGVMYVAPVLNEYLHRVSEMAYRAMNIEGATVSRYYRPFQWIPHVTIAKTLDREQMRKAFEEMQNTWGAFGGKVTKIGLAKTNPYKEIKLWEL